MTETNKPRQISWRVNRWIYAIFTLAGILFLALRDYNQAWIFLGTALIFEPFPPKVPFGQRPAYQRWWFMVHVVLILIILVFMAWRK
jgi:hypothetical protein